MDSNLREWRALLKRNWVFAWVLAAFAASMCVSAILGIRFSGNRLHFFWQYLDAALLENDLLRSLWNLHSQPPLFNAFLGVVLKLFPETHRLVFGIAFWMTGLFLLLGMAWVMKKLGIRDVLNAVVCTVFALSPTFMVYTNWLFYTLPAAAILLATGACLIRYREAGLSLWAHAFSWGCAVAMLTRSTYHPIWFAGVLIVLILMMPRGLRRTLAISAVLPFLVTNAWYAKNLVQVGMYTSSSWMGMNLAHSCRLTPDQQYGWQLPPGELNRLVEAGKLPQVWLKRAFEEPLVYRDLGYFDPSNSAGLHEADGAPCKRDGGPNFNHRDYARISKAMLKGAVALIKEHPEAYLLRVRDGIMLFVQPGPNSTHFLVRYNFKRVIRFKDATTKLLFCGKPYLPNNGGRPEPNLLLIEYPLVLLYGAWVAFGGRGQRTGATRAFMAYAVLTTLWAAACSVGLEVGENDRMRWETDPLVFMVGAHLVQTAMLGVVGLARTARLRPGGTAGEQAVLDLNPGT